MVVFYGRLTFANSEATHISVIDYDQSSELLFVNLVAPVEGNPALYLNADGILSELERFELIGEHGMVVHLPCDDFKGADTLIYRRGEATLTLGLDGITCSRHEGRLQQPRLVHSQSRCVIDPRGTTLWRVGSLLAEKNGYSVYQNMYAVFLSNRHHFVDEDITRMQDNLLLCPPEEMIASIDKGHAAEMFQEAEAFRLASNMQKAVPARSEETNNPDEGGSGPLAMTMSAAMGDADNGLDANASSWADNKAEGDELLVEVSPTDIIYAEEDSGREALAIASADRGVPDNGPAVDADIKDEGRNQLDQVIVLAEVAPAEPAHNEEDSEQEVFAIAATALNATENDTEGEQLIAETSFATISGDDVAAVPKLVIAIDGAKSAGPLNIVPGCYIEPNNKTLWRIGVALNKLNGHSVYQNMYAVFAVNPKAFPSGDVNHMLNQQLRCPTALEVTSRTVKESQHLLKQNQWQNN